MAALNALSTKWLTLSSGIVVTADIGSSVTIYRYTDLSGKTLVDRQLLRGGNSIKVTADSGATVALLHCHSGVVNYEFDDAGTIGAIVLPARIRDLINGPIFMGLNGQITLGFTPSALVPLPTSVEATQYYVSTTGSDANNGTTWALAKRSISAAITLGNTAAVPYRINVGAGLYDRTQSHISGASAVVPTQPCRFVAYGGQAILHTAGALTWTLESGTTYQATRSNVGSVIDWLTNNQYGDPTGLTSVASLVLCRATPWSWYTDGTTTYVNRGDGAAVTDANTAALLGNIPGMRNSTSGNTWLEGFTFLGGSDGNVRLVNNVAGRFYSKNCKFLYAKDNGHNTDYAVQSQDIGLAVFEACTAAYSQQDGFNFHTNAGSVPKAVLVDCLGYENGLYPTYISCNGLTGHDGGAYLDVRGRYTRNHGGDFAFTNANTVACGIGTVAINGYGDLDRGGQVPPNNGLHSINTATMYLFGAVGNRLSESSGTFVDMAVA